MAEPTIMPIGIIEQTTGDNAIFILTRPRDYSILSPDAQLQDKSRQPGQVLTRPATPTPSWPRTRADSPNPPTKAHQYQVSHSRPPSPPVPGTAASGSSPPMERSNPGQASPRAPIPGITI